jgi:hypothetical protein
MNATIPLENRDKFDLAIHKAKALLSVTACAVLNDDAPAPAEVYNTCWIAIDLLEEAERAAKGEVQS